MNREQVKALLDTGILQAFAEGKTVQHFSAISEEKGWTTVVDMALDEIVSDLGNYRIKPEPVHNWVVESIMQAGGVFMVYDKTVDYMKRAYPDHQYYRVVNDQDEE